jgi:peptidoglycan/xylan/chitin deacetylase (PgdA/CDA1 family)
LIWDASPHPLAAYADAPEERAIRLGSYKHREIFWTVGYALGQARVLARFEDGAAAIIENQRGRGRAIAIGGSLIDLVVRSYLDRDFEVQKVGANAFEPSTDSHLLLIKAAYEAFVPHGFTIGTTPPGMRGALILTHDIDARNSFDNISDFARKEKRFGARSTIFVQTKYVGDYYDAPYMSVDNLRTIRKLGADGFEIGSHTVSHTPHFPDLPLGEAVREPEGYHPRVLNLSETADATVRGEVMVSKRVLERDGIQGIRSFRTGHLHFNKHLVATLEEAGYLYDASVGVYHCACNFPFRQFRNRSFSAQSHVIEIPMTMSDYDWVENLTELTPVFKQIILRNAANGAPTTLLIHPTRKADKLEALEQVLTWLPDDIWTGTVEAYGRFWDSRYGLNPRITTRKAGYVADFRPDRDTEPVTINLNSAVDVVKAPRSVEIVDRRTILLPAMEAGEDLRLALTYKTPAGGSVTIRSPGGPLGEDRIAVTASLAAGVESYDDYDRRGEAPIVRASFSARKPLSLSSGIKLWDHVASRTGEAAETENELGLTFDGDVSSHGHLWLRLANRTYSRKFVQSTLAFNEPRLGVTLKYTYDRFAYSFDTGFITAFYTSPDSIADKTFTEVVAEPTVRYSPRDWAVFRIKGNFGRRVYDDENIADIYQTDFTRYGGGLEAEFRRGRIRLGLSGEWTVRDHSDEKDRTSMRLRASFESPVTADAVLALRAGYSDAEFTEADYDRFYWGEALTAYSISPSLTFTHWAPLMLSLGSTYRTEDYKQGPYNMQYLSAWFGFSTSF